MNADRLAAALRLYLIADPDLCAGPLTDAVEAALAGGVTAVQLRAKSMTDRGAVALGRQLRDVTARHGAAFIVNDRLDIALAAGADGVHLGVTDLDPADARAIAPPGFLIGYSPNDASDVSGAGAADYYGIGPVFGTGSKPDAGAALGLEQFGERVASSPVPVVGIGGIDASNAGGVVERGAIGIAVISAILGHPKPQEAARHLRRAVDGVEIIDT
jgi:thiamine-phosphate diphosphorylase